LEHAAVPAGSQQVAVVFSPDGRTLATVGWGNGRTYLWDVATGRRTATLSDPSTGGGGASVAFSPDGTILAAVEGINGDTALWDVTNGHLVADLSNPSGSARMSLVFSPDRQMLATADADMKTDVWDVRTGRLIATLTTPGFVDGVAFSPGSRSMAFVDNSDHAYLCPVSDQAVRIPAG
jgi:WD40 repeat protein